LRDMMMARGRYRCLKPSSENRRDKPGVALDSSVATNSVSNAANKGMP
jgi:hypothetical protein